MLFRIFDFFLTNTEKTAIGSMMSFCIGYLPNWSGLCYTEVQQHNILFYFQIAAYSISVIVGILAAMSYIIKGIWWIGSLKHFKRGNKKHKD